MSTPSSRLTFAAGRVLRWSYAAGDQACHCDITFNPERGLYEFRVYRPHHSCPTVEFYSHALKAVQRQSEFEAQLLKDGYSLTAFETILVPG